MKTAFLFPGQGAQYVGMGRDLYDQFAEARRVFAEAEEAVGLPLRRLCFEGPEAELARTDVCQPAVFTVSAAMLAVLREVLDDEELAEIGPSYVAGLSLGEYTALYGAGAIDLRPAAWLVSRRGELMHQAALARPSGMVSVLGVGEPEARRLALAAAGGQTLACANFNCPGQVVLSGAIDACERAERLARAYGAVKAIRLKVAGGFHSRIMAPAADGLVEALRAVDFQAPRMPVVANVDARPYARAEEIPARLMTQLTSAVRWRQSMEFLLRAGVEAFYEVGPGKTLTGLMRRICRDARVTSLDSCQAIQRLRRHAKTA